jgi:hypothetical protein
MREDAWGRPLDPKTCEEASRKVVASLKRVFGSALTGVIFKGSALKGDFIAFWSDLDFHAFVASAEMSSAREPHRHLALALQREFGTFVAEDFQAGSLQLYCIDASNYPADWVPSLPGTYQVVFGAAPECFAPVDMGAYRRRAEQDLIGICRFIPSLPAKILDHPDSRLPGWARRMGMDVKCLAYVVPICAGNDPDRVWRLPLLEAIRLAEPIAFPSRALSRFFDLVPPWPADIGRTRKLIELGLEAADDAAAWRDSR